MKKKQIGHLQHGQMSSEACIPPTCSHIVSVTRWEQLELLELWMARISQLSK